MSVREHLLLQLGVVRTLRWLLMVVLAAVLVWLYPEHSLSVFKRLLMFGAFLLYFWFLGAVVGTLLGVPMARPRCPRCASKLTLGPNVISCPNCNVSFDAKIQRGPERPSRMAFGCLTRGLLVHRSIARRHRGELVGGS